MNGKAKHINNIQLSKFGRYMGRLTLNVLLSPGATHPAGGPMNMLLGALLEIPVPVSVTLEVVVSWLFVWIVMAPEAW